MTTQDVKDNVFYQARMRAAEKDTTYESRLSAGYVLGIGQTRLYQIEKGLRIPHTDEVLMMEQIYNAPELLKYYCDHICPIGERMRELK